MKTDRQLEDLLRRIDGKGYKAYNDLRGEYTFPTYRLYVDHVQGDPFASPSRVRVVVERKASGFTEDMTANRSRAVALRDFLTRQFNDCCRKFARGNRGTGKSGLITVDKPEQEILERSSVLIHETSVEARFFMGLPAAGRRISSRDAKNMFFEELPRIVNGSLFFPNLDREMLYRHIETAEDADFARDRLRELGLIAFVAEGSRLPRASGIDPRPMEKDPVVPFRSPGSLKVQMELPNGGNIAGMGIPRGVTLIVGGGYHGKSTLLNALELGIYNHIPGDGRELSVTVSAAVKVRAADGRRIEKTDISPFIKNLPFGKPTTAFSTENASGSTSQAANISEAIEAGAEVLFLDEDTSATNFMIRDYRMQQLVSKDKEPITPFIDKVRQLYGDLGVSTVLVMGGSGDYFSVADHVIQITNYVPFDVTERAHEIETTTDTGRIQEGGRAFEGITERIPLPESFNPFRGRDKIKISAKGIRELIFGRTSIDLWDLEQMVDASQTKAIGYAIHYAERYMDGNRTLKEILDCVLTDVEKNGLDNLTPHLTGDLAWFRGIELAAAINRMRTLRMKQKG